MTEQKIDYDPVRGLIMFDAMGPDGENVKVTMDGEFFARMLDELSSFLPEYFLVKILKKNSRIKIKKKYLSGMGHYYKEL